MKLRASNLFRVASLAMFLCVVAAIAIHHRAPRYNGRSLEEWFSSPTNQQSIQAFKKAGTNAFPFLLEKLNGSGRFAACSIISSAFNKSEIEHSKIEVKLQAMLTSGGQSEQIDAYSIIRKFDLTISDSLIANTANRSIKASERELSSSSKLARLYSMTNSLDCAFIAQLCNDPDPQVRMLVFDFLERAERNTKDDLCSREVIPALLSAVEKTNDAPVLRSALTYIAAKPQRIQSNLGTIGKLLEITPDSNLQMTALGLLAVLPSNVPLTPDIKLTLEKLGRSASNPDVRHQASNLLSSRSFLSQR